MTNRRSTSSDSSCLGTTDLRSAKTDPEGDLYASQEGLYLGFGDSFFDLKMEVNFCLKEVLELVEKVEDLELEGIVKVWMCGAAVVVEVLGAFSWVRRGRTDKVLDVWGFI